MTGGPGARDGVDCPLRPNPDVIAQRMGEECVIVHLRTNRIYEMNGTATRFWELLSAGHDCGQIHAQMLREFDVGSDELTREIETVVSFMKERGLVLDGKGE